MMVGIPGRNDCAQNFSSLCLEEEREAKGIKARAMFLVVNQIFKLIAGDD